MKENIKSIKSYRIDSGNPGPEILITAGVHGDEFEPILASLELIKQMPLLLRRGVVTVVPVVNVTAYDQGIRYGEDGLDLARICPGNEEGTASERNAFQVTELIRKADYLVDMHTGGMAHYILPMSGFMLHSSEDVLAIQREMAFACNFPVVWGTDNAANGRTLSIARDLNIPAIYLEYGGGSGIRDEVVKGYYDAITNILKYLDCIEGMKAKLKPEEVYWVEDSRADSGYFQSKMPSPAEGIFVCAVKPGEVVKRGEPFGRIINPFTSQEEEILIDQDGLILSVRVAVRVRKGDALGSILPITARGKVTTN